ncbi:cell surface glycoprotein CD200 receptor 1 [Tachyglossus aculeatus]|uniref:cell surface glycoprotein CD200 receptor 1 n=1 Tax=Tachyglossus aculeatus TaxID=9261 RepID=UPI0018F352E6|nr:cell surface glycoprotein CD200 receptor 1 [Tachyglossus aculeatus]
MKSSFLFSECPFLPRPRGRKDNGQCRRCVTPRNGQIGKIRSSLQLPGCCKAKAGELTGPDSKEFQNTVNQCKRLVQCSAHNLKASANSSGPSLLAQTLPTLVPDKEAQACSNFNKGCTLVEAAVGSKATLSCRSVPLENLIMVSWTIVCSRTANWTMAYRNDTAHITTPPDVRLAWGPRPDLNPVLQIDPVTITDDSFYRCDVATSQGNFDCGFCLSVLVPPVVSLVVAKDNRAVCKASAGKPAAQISWVPPGEHNTSSRTHGNGTVTVVSTYWGNSSHLNDLVCSVGHMTGNRNLSMHGTSGPGRSQLLSLFLTFSGILGILAIVGAIQFWKLKSNPRASKSRNTGDTLRADEDTLEPYASYTERNNPLYSTRTEVAILHSSQRDDFLIGLRVL